MINLAPIVLFVYNRPEHTRKTLEALALNQLASNSILYIYADGAKENAIESQLQAIKQTREVIREQQWCGEVKIIESDFNKGLASSIVDGVTEVVNKHGKIIVLEDDIVTSGSFLKYMNDALNYYYKENKVMHVSGYFPPIKNIDKNFFFYNQTSCWGWATWSRAWRNYNSNAKSLRDEIILSNRSSEFNLKNSYPFLTHLENNISGKWDTWAVKWHATVFLMNGLCLHPHISYTLNIGFDGTGTHCNKNLTFKDSGIELNKSEFEPVNSYSQSPKILKKVIKHNLGQKQQNEGLSFFKIFKKIKNSNKFKKIRRWK